MQRTDILERKIKTAKDLRSIVKTMKVLAAVSISQYEDAVESITGYFETIEQGLQIMMKNQPNINALLKIPKNHAAIKRAVLIFGSGQPMCGTFNEILVSFIKDQWDKKYLYVPDKVVAIGPRIIPSLERIDWQVDQRFEVPSTIDGINETVQSLVVAIQQWYSEGEFQQIFLFYNQPNEKSQYTSVSRQLLPIDTEWLQDLALQPWDSRTLPTYSMEIAPLFSSLLRQLLFVSIYKAFAESLSAENNSRLAAMQMAEKKIDEKLNDLTQAYRNQRQVNITEEILDITASFEVQREQQ